MSRWNYSQIAAFLRCQYAWHLQYREGLQPKVGKLPMTLGTLVHNGIAAGLVAREDRRDDIEASNTEIGAVASEIASHLSPEDLAEFDPIAMSAPSIAERALKEFPAERWETITPFIEHTVEYKIGRAVYHGTKDWVARDRETGFVWIFDWKVRKSIVGYRSDLDVQAILYQKLLERHRIDGISGSVNVQLLAGFPKRPTLNKNGSMSRTAIRTTWEVYRSALVEADLNPADYDDVRETLEHIQWVVINYAPRTQQIVDAVWAHARHTTAYMRGCNKPLRALSTFICTQCQYLELCLERLKGLETSWLEKQHFTKGG